MRMIFALLLILGMYSCGEKAPPVEPAKVFHHISKPQNGLLIEHGNYRGTEYTDSLDVLWRLKYKPIRMKNDSTIPIHVELDFDPAYDYPEGHDEGSFQVFPLPGIWAADPTTDAMFNEMWKTFESHIDNPTFSATIAPGEEAVLALGTLYLMPNEPWSVVPEKLFVHDAAETLPECKWRVNPEPSTYDEKSLGVKLVFPESCAVIHCGWVSFPEE